MRTFVFIMSGLLLAIGAHGGGPPLGNVFLTSEEVRLSIETAVPVQYAIRDLWGRLVKEGVSSPEAGHVIIRPPVGKLGYFTLEIDGKERTSFAVIAPPERDRSPDAPFGVMCHFAQGWDVDVMALIAKAGINSFRDEHYWAHLERRRGVYEFPERSDRYMQEAARLGLAPLIVMSFGNALYDHPEGPFTPEGYEAYARYGEAIINRYRNQIRWLEVWNEYNGTWCPPPARADRAKYYAEMIRHVHQYLKPKYPDVKLLGCACVGIPLPYIEGIFRCGGLDYMDAVVIHPYRDTPEGVELEMRELKELIKRYNGGKEKPIWATEVGAMTGTGRERASYLVRIYTLLLSEGTEKVYHYLLKNYADFPDMGLLEDANHPFGRYAVKPPYVAYANLIRQLGGARYIRREAYRKYTRAYVFLFRKGGDEIRVCWSIEPTQIELKTRRSLAIIDMMGSESELKPNRGKAVLELGPEPVYIKGDVQSVDELATSPPVIADSFDDFGPVQGADGWLYGHYDGDGQGQGDSRAPSGPYTDDDFEPMEWSHDEWSYFWQGPGERWFLISRGGGHPGSNGPHGAWPVRRWKSPVAGKIRLLLDVSRKESKGDGIEVKVFIDGREIFSEQVGGRAPINLHSTREIEVDVGTLIDLAVSPGPARDNSYDSFSLRARISLLSRR